MTCVFIESLEGPVYKWAWNVGMGIGGLGRTGTFNLGAGNPSLLCYTTAFLDSTKEHATVIAASARQFISLSGETELFRFHGDWDGISAPTSATTHVSIAYNPTTHLLKAYRGATLLGSVTWTPPSGWSWIEARVVLSDSVGQVQVRVDEALVLNLTGVDTKNGGTASVINGVSYVVNNGSSSGTILDDFIINNGAGSVNNSYPGNRRIEFHLPNGNGALSQWVGSDGNSVDNYQLIDDLAGTSDYIASSTPGDADLHTYPASAYSAARNVATVCVSAYALKTDANARTFRLLARDATPTVGDSADFTPVNGAYGPFYAYFEAKPSGGAWTVADVNAAQFGVRAE